MKKSESNSLYSLLNVNDQTIFYNFQRKLALKVSLRQVLYLSILVIAPIVRFQSDDLRIIVISAFFSVIAFILVIYNFRGKRVYKVLWKTFLGKIEIQIKEIEYENVKLAIEGYIDQNIHYYSNDKSIDRRAVIKSVE